MFSDTHFHLQYLSDNGVDCRQILLDLANRGSAFALDIGTKCDDLPERLALTATLMEGNDAIRAMLHFSGGIWPSVDAIQYRAAQVSSLKGHLTEALSRVCALGECGLDHHWHPPPSPDGAKVPLRHPSGADNRSEDDFDAAILKGEAELFEMQLELARVLGLPVIVHSRDAFDGTLSCIKNVGYDNGVIHCFSYGIDEARAFLERGWYISFTGAVTYTKKARLDEVKKLLAFIPRDRLLLETDAPYLAPVPFRGTVNTPVLVEYVYRFVAGLLEIDVEALSNLVDTNAKQLFYELMEETCS
jgi:TatD DNase family protein